MNLIFGMFLILIAVYCLHRYEKMNYPKEEWISLKSKIPPLNKMVLVKLDSGQVFVGYRTNETESSQEWSVVCEPNDVIGKTIVEWRSIPN